MANEWVNHVKQFANFYKISFNDALKSPACRDAYNKHEYKEGYKRK